MDCPICYESISETTGKVTTSCGHTFHFKCLNGWYTRLQMEDEGELSCPYCRTKAGEYEKTDSIQEEEDDEEEEEESVSNWIRIGEGHWVIRPQRNRLHDLAEAASRRGREDKYAIPPYNAERHAYWNLRHFFENSEEQPQMKEPLHTLDRPKMVRKRKTDWGKTFWVRLGEDLDLKEISGYKSD